MRTRIALLILVAVGLTAANVSSTEYLGIIKYLASPEMRGRGTGSPELEKAAGYLRDQFRSMRLKPLSGDSYYQDFDVTTTARLGKRNSVTYTAGDKPESLRINDDFIPLNLSGAGDVSGSVVLAGFGISAPEYNYDDYKGLDAKGKIVVILRHEPQEFDDKSIFEGKVYTAHSQIFAKATNAKIHGARAIIFVNDVPAHPKDKDELDAFGTTEGPANAGIGFVQITFAAASQWFKDAGKNLEDIEKGIDADLKPRSFDFPSGTRVDLNVDVKRETKRVHNVGAYWPGETNEYVIIGAHYDH